jgi:predicted RNase H-like HicB family nuclease
MTSTQVFVQGLAAVRWDDDAKVYVSWTPGLDVYSQGTTQEEALKALDSAVSMFVRRCHEKGILDDTMLNAGYIRMSAHQPMGTAFNLSVRRSDFDQFFPKYDALSAISTSVV